MRAPGRDAAQHGAGEVVERPVADPVVGIGRDIGRDEGSEGAFEAAPAGQDQALLYRRVGLDTGAGVTAGAARRPEDALAMFRVG
jgi:hypothetical protein